MSNTKTFKLSDDAISVIAKNLQLALLTGTDIVDHLRMMELFENEGKLSPTDNYNEQFEINVQTMLETLRKLQEENNSDEQSENFKSDGDTPFDL